MNPVPTTVPGVVLRSAREEDVDVIQGFIEALAAYERLSHEVEATPEALRESLFGENPAAWVILAEADGTPAGFALAFRTFSTFLARPGLYLEDLFVQPAFRGRGIGTALLAYLAHHCVAHGYGRLEWAVLDWNEPAQRVYRRAGAAALSDWTVQRVSGDQLKQLGKRFEDEFRG